MTRSEGRLGLALLAVLAASALALSFKSESDAKVRLEAAEKTLTAFRAKGAKFMEGFPRAMAAAGKRGPSSESPVDVLASGDAIRSLLDRNGFRIRAYAVMKDESGDTLEFTVSGTRIGLIGFLAGLEKTLPGLETIALSLRDGRDGFECVVRIGNAGRR